MLMARFAVRHRRVVLLLVLLGVSGCGGSSPTAPGPPAGQTPAPAPTPAPPPVPVPPAVLVLARFEIAPSPVIGSGGVDATLTLVDARTEDVIVQLSSSDGAAVVPGTVTIRAGSTTATVRIPTRVVSQDVDVTITASAAGHTVTAPLRVLALKLADLRLTPTEIGGGFRVAMTAQLNGTVGVDGSPVLVELSSSDSIVSVPATIRVLDRQMTIATDLPTRNVTTPTTVTVTGRAGGATRTATVRVLPVFISSVSDANDFPTGGGSHYFAPEAGYSFSGQLRNGAVFVSARLSSTNIWDLFFQGPSRDTLGRGHYVMDGSLVSSLSFSMRGRACNVGGMTGEFDVLDVEYAGAQVVRFEATFKQRCGLTTTTGTVRVASLPPLQ